MQNEIVEWFGGFATITGLTRVIFGYVAGIASYWLWCKYKHKKFYINWRYVGIILGLCVMTFTSIQTNVAYNLAAKTAVETKECAKVFQEALIKSRDITTVNDKLSVDQRNLLAEKDRLETEFWMKVLAPPEPIGSMDINDPVRQTYGLAVLKEYTVASAKLESKIQDITDQQIKLAESRPPLPDPTCGK